MSPQLNDYAPIPFGLRSKDQRYVDVSEVERGLKCKCECPSCGTPLIARQGEVREWHFAHASKGVSESTKSECEYSFWVSVISMAKQVISKTSSIKLPSLTMFSSDGKAVQVTRQQIAKVGEVRLEIRVDQVKADAVLSVDEYSIAVVFTAPNRTAVTDAPHGDEVVKTGVLEISLNNAMEWMFENGAKGEYTKKISQHIINDVGIKKWLFHPRMKRIEEEQNLQLNRRRPVRRNFIKQSPFSMKNHNRPTDQTDGKFYKCRNCDFHWRGTNVCVYCNTHRYSTEVNEGK